MLSNSTIAIIILILVIISFATQRIPLPVTALLGGLAMMLAGIIEPGDVISGFGSDTVMMVAGVIVIGNAMFETGLATDVGRLILKIDIAARNERIFLLIVLCIAMVMSAFMSNTATMAVFMPLIASISAASDHIITKKNTYMAVGIASVIGGNLTLAGSTPQLIAQSILASTDGVREMSFFELLRGTLPLAAVTLAYYGTIGYYLQRRVFNFPEQDQSGPELCTGQPDCGSSGNTCKKAISLGILALVIAGFCTGVYSMGTVALLGACLCVLTGCISMRRIYETMDWSTVLVLGGAIGFSNGLSKSGAVSLIAGKIAALSGQREGTEFLIFALLVVLASLLTNFMSNTATISIILPIGLSVAAMIGINPITLTVGIVMACNLAFATPIGTPPVTMTLTAGYRFSDYLKVGGLLNVLLLVTAIFTIPILYGL